MINNRRYRWLLLDADDTFFDFGRCQHEALRITMEKFGITPDEESIEIYNRINVAIWKKLELGLIEKSELVWKRFEEFSDRMGYGIDPVAMAETYENNLAGQSFLLPGAYGALEELSGKYELYVITNGLEHVQTERFRKSGLANFFGEIFISGKIGWNKPSSRFFDAVAERIPGFDKSRALVIGDSLSSDIKGGAAYGLDTCWINFRNEEKPDGYGITYTAGSLSEVPELLERAGRNTLPERVTAACCELAASYTAFHRDYALAPVSSFRIGGNADLAVFPADASQLSGSLRILEKYGIPVFIAGNTSNILFDDAGFRGCVLFLSQMKGVRSEGTRIYACAGDSLTSVCRAAKDASLTGIEFAYGIPGSVGGAVCMNAGAYGGQMSDVLESVSLLDSRGGDVFTVPADKMHFSYRHSLVTENRDYIVVGAVFRLYNGSSDAIAAAMNDYSGRRRAKQPLEYPSAGSVFKRPAPDVFVGKLIEDAGLKGFSIGGARISEKHAGFIINAGGATSADVNALVEYIKEKIAELYGVALECEIIRVPSEA